MEKNDYGHTDPQVWDKVQAKKKIPFRGRYTVALTCMAVQLLQLHVYGYVVQYSQECLQRTYSIIITIYSIFIATSANTEGMEN